MVCIHRIYSDKYFIKNQTNQEPTETNNKYILQESILQP